MRKKKGARDYVYMPVAFRREPQPMGEKEEAEIIKALEFAVNAVGRGFRLPKNLEAELLRFLRAEYKRADSNYIVNTVNKYATNGHPVTKGSAAKETAFEATAAELDKKHHPGLTPENVERIYYKAINEYVKIKSPPLVETPTPEPKNNQN